MNQQEIEKIIKLRTYIIECHNSLDGPGNQSAVVKQTDVAHEYSQLIKMVEDLLNPYVNFE